MCFNARKPILFHVKQNITRSKYQLARISIYEFVSRETLIAKIF